MPGTVPVTERPPGELESALRAIHVIASTPASAEDGIRAILEFGRRRFGMSHAVVSRFDPRTGACVVVTSCGEGGVCAGGSIGVADTLCRRVAAQREQLAIDRVADGGGSPSACNSIPCACSFLGVPLLLDGEVQGVLHFSDGGSRDLALTEVDREILTLMADWIAGQLARWRVQQDLDHRDAGLRDLIATTQDAVVFMDGVGIIRDLNASAERIFGYPAGELVGEPVTILMAEPYRSEHAEYVARYERTGEKRAIGQIRIVSARRRDGEIFPIELTVTEMRGAEPIRYGAFIRDISEKVRLQSQLMERERLAVIGTTAAMFAHEIGNPLNSMSLQLQLLQRRFARDGKADVAWVAEKVELVRSELQRLILLLDEFRSLSRRQQYSFKPCDLTALVQRVVKAERASFESKGVHVVLDLAEVAPLVLVDEDKVTQVIINLCKNAIEAMEGDEGRLRLRTAAEADCLLVEVTDTGPGIPEEIDVFAPFVTTKKGGTGLGLPIVRQIMSAHEGSVEYLRADDQTTTFRLRFPVFHAESEAGR